MSDFYRPVKRRGGRSIVNREEGHDASGHHRWGDTPIEIGASLEPASDVLEAYERIVADPARAWMHGENEKGFLCSRWQPPLEGGASFSVRRSPRRR